MKTFQFFLTAVLLTATSLAFSQDPIYVDETASRLPTDAQMGVRLDVGDVDNDGDIDIIVANGQHSAPPAIPSQVIMLQINDGNGFFTDGSGQLPPSASGQQLANAAILGDVDGDGNLDVFVANGSSGGVLCPSTASQNWLWLNDGSGNYTDRTDLLPPYLDCSFDATFGDIDSDGDLDIVVANVGIGGLGEVNRILINDGSGSFSDATYTAQSSPPADITYTIALGDLDADGDLDMVIGNAKNSAPLNRFLRNDGGVFSEVSVSWTAYPPSDWPRPVWDVKLADMNGDGTLDVLMSDALDSLRMILMLNQGEWEFTSQTIYVSFQYGLDVADVDNDGDMDILVSQAKDAGFPLVLLLNDGNPSPTFDNIEGWPDYLVFGEEFYWDTNQALFRFPKFVDVNHDGAVDIYLPTLVWWWWITYLGETEYDHQDRLLMNTLVPEQNEIEAAMDIKFCSNPDAFNCKKKGVLPLTIFGTDSLDVTTINISTLQLCKEDLSSCTSAPVDYSMNDLGDPLLDLGTAACERVEVDEGVFLDLANPDGFLDINVAFDVGEVKALLGTFCTQDKGAVSEALVITGMTVDGTDMLSVPISENGIGVDRLWKVNK